MNRLLPTYPNIFVGCLVPQNLIHASVLGVWVFLALTILSCAGQVPPPGGPPDTEPPEIVQTSPAQNQTGVRPDAIDLEFSEYVDRRSVEQSVFISPYLGNLKFEWGGTDVRITFSDSLRRNTTYVVTVGTDVIDVRAQNRMSASFVLAFSTGDSIDKGAMSGRVYDDQPDGIMVFVYPLTGQNPDTLSPSRQRPHYLTQTGRGGTFALSNLALGPYRLFAVKDEYRNLTYDRDIDLYGVLPIDVTLTPSVPAIADLAFRLAREDTVQPFLSSVTSVHPSFVEFRTSEPLETNALEHGRISIVDTAQGRPVEVLVKYLSHRDPSIGGVILAHRLDSAGVYRLTIDSVRDRSGNLIDSAHASLVFVAVDVSDTVHPAITLTGLTDSTRGYSIDRPLEVVSTEPVHMGMLLRAAILTDSLGRQVASEVEVRSPIEGSLAPRRPLQGKAWYSVSIPLDSVIDYSGRSRRDSTVRIRFETMDLRSTGTMEGSAVDRRPGAVGPIYVTASSVGLSPPQVKTVRLAKPGSFKFDLLPEAQYALFAFRDSDSSGLFTTGLPFPYVPSERFVVGADTVKVRARWAVEGIKLELR